MKTSFVRKEADFSLTGTPWGLRNRFPASERASSLCLLPLTPAGRACPWAATDPWAGDPQAGMACRGHHFHGCMFFPRVVAISALCGLCPRGLSSLDGERARGGSFIPVLQVLAQGQSWISSAHSLFGSATQDEAFEFRWMKGVGHSCRASSSLACPRCQPRKRQGRGPGQGISSIPAAGARPLTVGRFRRFPLNRSVPVLPSHRGCSLHSSQLIWLPSLAVPWLFAWHSRGDRNLCEEGRNRV